MATKRVITLGPGDIDRLVEFELICFDPTIQADRETLLKRLELGHTIYGLEEEGILVGAVAFSYARFDPSDRTSFPNTETEFALQPVPSNYNAVFVYSRGIHPSCRGQGYSKRLVSAALDRAKTDGCVYAVGNPRTATYAGSNPDSTHESIAPQPRLRAAIDHYLAGGEYPSKEVLLSDPILLFHSHLPGCRFHWILPNFAPHDPASGGIRVIVYSLLAEWRPID